MEQRAGGPGSIPGRCSLFIGKGKPGFQAKRHPFVDGGKQRRKRQGLFNGRRKRKRRRRANQPSYFSPFIEERRAKKKLLPGGESNPGLPRDRRRYSPLYYRGSQHVGQTERSDCYTLQLLIEKKKSCSRAGNRTPAAAVRAPNPNH